MLGTDLCAALRAHADAATGHRRARVVIGVDLPDLDITDAGACRACIVAAQARCVIHCAGYTDVDGCTREPQRAFAVNAAGTLNVAEAAERVGARLVYISTDYIFDGAKGAPYVEHDAPNPINVYGESKLLGEQYVRQVAAQWQIVRTQWLFGLHGRNFIAAIINAAKTAGSVRAVSDQIGSPTYTKDLSKLICHLMRLPLGVYHATNCGSGSWYDVAKVALRAAGMAQVELEAISAADWESPTARPAYSVLENAALRAAGVPPARPWQQAVRDYVAAYLARQRQAAGTGPR